MWATLLQQGFDVGVPEQTGGQKAIAFGVAVVVLVLAAAMLYRTQYAGLDSTARKHKSAIQKALRRQAPATLRLPRDVDIHAERGRLRQLYADGMAGATPEGRETVRGALGAMRQSLGESVSETVLFKRVPKQVRWLGELSVLVAGLGAVAVSTDLIVHILTSEAGGPTLLSYLQAFGSWLLSVSVDIFAGFASIPFGGELWGLTLAIGTLVVEWVYQRWLLAAVLLAVAAVVVWALEERLPAGAEDRLYSPIQRRFVAWRVVGGLVAVWALGVGPTLLGETLGNALGMPSIASAGEWVGFALSVTAFAGLLTYGLLGFVRTLYASAIDWERENPQTDRYILWYAVARRAGAVLAVVLAPLVPLYAIAIVLSGSWLRVLAALLQARLGIQVLLGVLALAGGAWLVLQVREHGTELRAGIVETLSRAQVRAALFRRGLPWVVGAVGYVVAYNLTQSIPLGLALAAVLTIGARLAYELLLYARDQASLLEREETRVPASYLIEAYRPEDADGVEHPWARINGQHTLAADDVETLLDAIEVTVEALQEDGEARATVASWYADDLVELGEPGYVECHDGLRENVRKNIFTELRENNRRVPVDELEDALGDHPDAEREAWLESLEEDYGIIRRTDGVVRLIRDPLADR